MLPVAKRFARWRKVIAVIIFISSFVKENASKSLQNLEEIIFLHVNLFEKCTNGADESVVTS